MATHLLSIDRQRSVLGAGVLNARAYSPYGVMVMPPPPALAYSGQYRDTSTGSYPLGNGHRFYSPTLMRFLSPDDLSPFELGGVNAYAYCGGDPVNRIDPTGRMLGLITHGIFGASAVRVL
jgi:RHS repeat-associated protein